MSLFGRNDQSVTANATTTAESTTGAPIGTHILVKSGGGNTSVRVDGANAHFGNTSPGSRANVDVAMFGNTTMSAFIPGRADGIFGVDVIEAAGVTGGPIAEAYVTFGGSGYGANANVTITVTNGGTSGVINAHATGGRIDQLNIQTAGSGYITNPTIAIDAPSIIALNGNSAISNDTIAFTNANSYFLVNDGVTISSNATSLPGNLTSGNRYYIVVSNTSAIKLSTTQGGSPIVMTPASGNSTTAAGFGLLGDTATGYVVSGGNKGIGISHAGWVLRTEGSGGRAGRVFYETLVAMGSLGAQTAAYGTPASVADANDNTILPNS